MCGKVLERVKINETHIVAVHGDITEESTDAIVNPANSRLKHGGGVAGAIVKKGGRIIQEESDKIGFVPVGKAVYTTAGKLKAKYVIHTVGPVWGEGDEERKLRSAVRSALEVADSLKLSSVSLPAISTGIFGYPKEEGVRVIVDEVIKYVKKGTGLREIRLVGYDELTAQLFAKEIARSKEVS